MKIHKNLSEVRLGQPQRHADITIFPLFDSCQSGLDYQTMDPSLMRGDLEINEISQDGQIPLLEADNHVDDFILLIDSEEIMGAKQNRVLNTSILLPKRKRTIIPVSCTEQGRWAYNSSSFQSSGNMMPKAARTRKTKSVTYACAKVEAEYAAAPAAMPAPAFCYQSNQTEVWEEVQMLQSKANIHSSTGAMSDVYESMKGKVNSFTDQFEAQTDQKGVLVLRNGRILGLDLLSASDAYVELHQKIVSSYVMESALEAGAKTEGWVNEEFVAKSFLEEISFTEGQPHDSPGEGMDVRFNGANHSGSALMYDGQMVHASFLCHEEELPPPNTVRLPVTMC